ncbi:MAG: hypothetical protein IJ764_02500 [Bacteroidales bacterium]|nr:hypothetical protein [Bacteroidales bacterium]
MKYDDDIMMQQLRQMQYPHAVNLVEGVMSQVRLSLPRPSVWHRWGRYVAAVAACVVVALSINVLIFFTKDYNEPQLTSMLASVYGYDQYMSQSIESYADPSLIDLLGVDE